MEKPAMEDMSARRKHPRVNCHWSGRLQNTQRKMARISVRNVSLGGVGVRCPMLLKKGDKVLLEFRGIYHQKTCDIRVICTVVFVVVKGAEYDVGLQFSSSTEKFRDFLADFINGRTIGE